MSPGNLLPLDGFCGGSWPWRIPSLFTIAITDICSCLQPNELKWKQLEQKGEDQPKPRSGHSLTWVGQNRYIMIGGIEDNQSNRIVPTSDIWQLSVGQSKCGQI